MGTQVLKVSLGKAVIDVADAKEALLKAQANLKWANDMHDNRRDGSYAQDRRHDEMMDDYRDSLRFVESDYDEKNKNYQKLNAEFNAALSQEAQSGA